MALSTITYSNKSDINSNSSVQAINKVQASDMNEIKTVVNAGINQINNLTGKVLWTNSSPNNAFSSQTITLNSSSYDMIEIFYYNWNSQKYYSSVRTKKGNNISLQCMIRNGTYGYIGERDVTYVSDTSLTFSDNYTLIDGNLFSTGTNNQWNIPIYVIGYTTGLWS